jgi:hypothetical protein
MRGMGIVYSIRVGKPQGNRPLGKCRHRCDDNIKMFFKAWMIWIGSFGLSRGIVAGLCEHGNEHLHSIKIRDFLEKLSELSASHE